MTKRFIEILKVLAKDLIEKGYDADDALKNISSFDMDFLLLKEELLTLELSQYTDETELDTIKALLSYVLMKETDLEIEDIYAFTFGRGRQIIWN